MPLVTPTRHTPKVIARNLSAAMFSVLFSSLTVALPGDIDEDGTNGISDRDARFRHLRREVSLTGTALVNADANGDGSVDVADLVQIARLLAPVAAQVINSPTSHTTQRAIVVTGTAEAPAMIEIVGGETTVMGTADGNGTPTACWPAWKTVWLPMKSGTP